tara:strand:- start:103 stop:297 length:195 start_codon:yes stop_codon:yes gene_type:complete
MMGRGSAAASGHWCLAVTAELVTRYDSILSVTWILGSSIAGNILAVQPEHSGATVVARQHRRSG